MLQRSRRQQGAVVSNLRDHLADAVVEMGEHRGEDASLHVGDVLEAGHVPAVEEGLETGREEQVGQVVLGLDRLHALVQDIGADRGCCQTHTDRLAGFGGDLLADLVEGLQQRDAHRPGHWRDQCEG